MKEEVRIEQFLGLPQDAASTEVKERCEALLGWLESDDIPDHLRSWAENQADIIVDIHEGLGYDGQADGPGLSDGPAGDTPRRYTWVVQRVRARAVVVTGAGVAVGLLVLAALWW